MARSGGGGVTPSPLAYKQLRGLRRGAAKKAVLGELVLQTTVQGGWGSGAAVIGPFNTAPLRLKHDTQTTYEVGG